MLPNPVGILGVKKQSETHNASSCFSMPCPDLSKPPIGLAKDSCEMFNGAWNTQKIRSAGSGVLDAPASYGKDQHGETRIGGKVRRRMFDLVWFGRVLCHLFC
jgi:hypothetical protein